MHDVLTDLALIFVLGVGAQWIAWRLRLPSILLLLTFGFLAGPIAGWLDPDALFGRDLISPAVGLCVAVILFEGGLTLHWKEVKGGAASVVGRLVSLGMLVTWLALAAAARLLFALPWEIALLLGAALVISGPTVVGPLLQHIRPTGPVGKVLKWEGIVIDPVGAIVATLVFEAILQGSDLAHSAGAALQTVLFGGLIGLAGAGLLVLLLWRAWLPERLEIPVTLTLVLAVSTASNLVQEESGLLAVTVMGIALANQGLVSTRPILRFKENLVVLLIAALFIVLAARMPRPMLFSMISLRGIAFLVFAVLVVRPLAVLVSTASSKLSWREKAFLACMAPRGIVSAAVVPLFALRLAETGEYPGVEAIVTITFLTIIGTVAVYGLTAPTLARRMGLAQADPQGVLLLGANPVGIELARGLRELGFRTLLVDTNWTNVREARLAGLEASYSNLLEPDALQGLDLGGLGRFIGVVPNDEVNSLAALHVAELFGRRNVLQLPIAGERRDRGHFDRELRGGIAFGQGLDYGALRRRLAGGERAKVTRLSEEFRWEDFLVEHGEDAVPLFVKRPRGRLVIGTDAEPLEPAPGDVVVALVRRADEEEEPR